MLLGVACQTSGLIGSGCVVVSTKCFRICYMFCKDACIQPFLQFNASAHLGIVRNRNSFYLRQHEASLCTKKLSPT